MNTYYESAQKKQAELRELLIKRNVEYNAEFPEDLKPLLDEVNVLLTLGGYSDMIDRLRAIVKRNKWYEPLVGEDVVTSIENIVARLISEMSAG